MTFEVTFIVLAILGIADAGYLVWQHARHKSLVCPLDHDCSVVTESKYAKIFGFRNEILGLIFYTTALVGIFVAIGVPALASLIKTLLVFGTLFGFLFSIFLTYVSFFKIRDYCFYCLISFGINTLLFLNSLAL
jgi:uncharacterized membrane protein